MAIEQFSQKTKKVLQPMRFVDAYHNFTPIQKDFIMLVQHMTSKMEKIQSHFTIDLKPYFKAKGIKLSDVRHQHYQEVTANLLESKVMFKYLKGDKLFVHQNLFNRCIVTKDFFLEVIIIDDVLPLFYINQLREGHFRDNRLVKELFQQSYPNYDNYISYHPKTYTDFRESQNKRLFEKLLQFKKLKKYTFEFTKNELYLLLGYGYIKETPANESEPDIFGFVHQEFIQTNYKGPKGWRSLRPLLNKWLKQISDHKDSGFKVMPTKDNYFTTQGRPIRSIYIKVVYDSDINLTHEQELALQYLKPYGLSDKQSFKIVLKFDFSTIKERISKSIVAKKDHYGNRYYGEYVRPDHRQIENLPGYIYGVVFQFGGK